MLLNNRPRALRRKEWIACATPSILKKAKVGTITRLSLVHRQVRSAMANSANLVAHDVRVRKQPWAQHNALDTGAGILAMDSDSDGHAFAQPASCNGSLLHHPPGCHWVSLLLWGISRRFSAGAVWRRHVWRAPGLMLVPGWRHPAHHVSTRSCFTGR